MENAVSRTVMDNLEVGMSLGCSIERGSLRVEGRAEAHRAGEVKALSYMQNYRRA